MPQLLAALTENFAIAITHTSSAQEVLKRFAAPVWAVKPRREWPKEAEVVATKLLGCFERATVLGTRAQIVVAAWSDVDCPLSAMPEDICRSILERAEKLCEEELGEAFTFLSDKQRAGGQDDAINAFSMLLARSDTLSNSPLVTSVAVSWALAPMAV